ncbi:MAG: permease [Verrucomicrobiae bacterium]|nr:permease [Verrucomicrobiae bacterium]
MSCCCEKTPEPPEPETKGDCCGGGSKHRRDWLLLGSAAVIAGAYLLYFFHGLLLLAVWPPLYRFCIAVKELIHLMWWGTLVGILAISLLQFVPRRRIEQWLGKEGNLSGLLRAVAAGLFFDVCSHGILLVSMQLYRKGLGLGQTMAFLIASPWNSFSTTFVLFALVGVKWTLLFIVGSLVIALAAGALFHLLERRGLVPANPYRSALSEEVDQEPGFREQIGPLLRRPSGWFAIFKGGLLESRMVVRWMLFGVILAAILRVAVQADVFSNWFGPSLAGLALTLVAATVIEVCSEGSSPIAADLLHRAAAPGNAFAFLMAGAATDYTEVLALRETTRSWKISLLLPALTVPQVVLIGWLMNRFGELT